MPSSIPSTTETKKVSLDVELRNAAAKLRSLAASATPGPWGTYDDGTGLIDIAADLGDTGHGYRCRRYIGQLEADQIDNDPAHRDWTEGQDRAQVQADAEYIALMQPAVGAALAHLLDVEADVVAARIAQDGTADYAADFGTGYLLDIARLINGEEAAS